MARDITSKLLKLIIKVKMSKKELDLINPNCSVYDVMNIIGGKWKIDIIYHLGEGTLRFAAGVAGGAAGETLVADVENIGTIGDALEFGPTQLEVDAEVDYEGGVAEDSFL